MAGALVTLQADFQDSPESVFRVPSFETGKAMAMARAGAMFDRLIGELDRTNESGAKWTGVYLTGHALVVEDSWEPGPEDGDFQCENCERSCVERTCCDNCEDCCHCDEWYCTGCDEYQSDDESSCERCDHCDSCCECHSCSSCDSKVSDDNYCGECEHCDECCTCCHCSDCGDRLDSDHGQGPDGDCYCQDCMPEDEDSEDED